MSKRLGIFTVILSCVSSSVSCSDDQYVAEEWEEAPLTDEVRQDLTSTELKEAANRLRVISECSYAMTGSWLKYNHTNWPTGNKEYAKFAYVSSDKGAWNLLLGGYGNNVSCRMTDGQVTEDCALSYGAKTATLSNYACQGQCTSINIKHGGQCKAFSNLIAYRSGVYRNEFYGVKLFLTDSVIASKRRDDTNMPMATYNTILPGDFLRKTGTNPHSLIVVRKIDETQKVVVFDSNWLDTTTRTRADGTTYTTYSEHVGSHIMSFSGSGISNLGNYRVLKCVYTGAC